MMRNWNVDNLEWFSMRAFESMKIHYDATVIVCRLIFLESMITSVPSKIFGILISDNDDLRFTFLRPGNFPLTLDYIKSGPALSFPLIPSSQAIKGSMNFCSASVVALYYVFSRSYK